MLSYCRHRATFYSKKPIEYLINLITLLNPSRLLFCSLILQNKFLFLILKQRSLDFFPALLAFGFPSSHSPFLTQSCRWIPLAFSLLECRVGHRRAYNSFHWKIASLYSLRYYMLMKPGAYFKGEAKISNGECVHMVALAILASWGLIC